VTACPAPLSPHVRRATLFSAAGPLALACGATLGPITVAYETYGRLDSSASNAVFICHALTGDSHPAPHGPGDLPGWWEHMVGPGRPVDTSKFFVVCANVLGGCAGTTGPWSPGPTGRPYGPDFPPLGIADLVAVHRALLAHLGVGKLHAVLGGSLGGMQVLEWLLSAPADAKSFLIIAGTARHSAENLAWNAVARAAIRSDERFLGGRYAPSAGPAAGLGLARMVAHLTYVCEELLELKFGREPRAGAAGGSPVIVGPFAVEGYLEHQAAKLAGRFDANSYLYLTSAMDRFDAFAGGRRPAARPPWPDVHLFSFESDRLYGQAHSQVIRANLAAAGLPAAHHHDTTASIGHDAFLLNVPGYLKIAEEILNC
jgi:homoserine O-acetyltransferase